MKTTTLTSTSKSIAMMQCYCYALLLNTTHVYQPTWSCWLVLHLLEYSPLLTDRHSRYRNVFCILLKKKITIISQLQTLGQQWPTSPMDWSNIGISTMAVTSHFLIGFKAHRGDRYHYWHGSLGQETEWIGLRQQENLLLLFCYSNTVNKMIFVDRYTKKSMSQTTHNSEAVCDERCI